MQKHWGVWHNSWNFCLCICIQAPCRRGRQKSCQTDGQRLPRVPFPKPVSEAAARGNSSWLRRNSRWCRKSLRELGRKDISSSSSSPCPMSRSHPRRRSKRQQSRRASLQLPQPPKGARKRCPEPRQNGDVDVENILRRTDTGKRGAVQRFVPDVEEILVSPFGWWVIFIQSTRLASCYIMRRRSSNVEIRWLYPNLVGTGEWNASMLLYVLNFLSNALRKFKEYVTISEMSH